MTKKPSIHHLSEGAFIAYHKTKGKRNIPKAFQELGRSLSGERAERSQTYVSTRNPEKRRPQLLKGEGYTPSVVFLGGFMSDMQGIKANYLEALCIAEGIGFLRFDYMGHGQSSGTFEEGTIGQWKANALAVLDHLTEGPQVLVGSSMGGWLMLLAAMERPERVGGMVGIASAPDFTEHLVWEALPEKAKEEIMAKGSYALQSEYNAQPYPITRQLIEEGRKHLVLQATIPITCPVRLIHGMQDEDVPYKYSIEIANKIVSPDVQLMLLKSASHRMSGADELDILGKTLKALVYGSSQE